MVLGSVEEMMTRSDVIELLITHDQAGEIIREIDKALGDGVSRQAARKYKRLIELRRLLREARDDEFF